MKLPVDPATCSHWLICAALILALGINVYTVLPYFSPEYLNFDAATYYVPYARRLIAEGMAFLATEDSVRYAPMSYVYPAFFGAEPMAVKTANIVLSCVLVLIAYRVGYLLHSRTAGVLAAFCLAVAPSIKPWVPTILTEPVFLFLLGVWLWGFTEIVVSENSRFVPVAGLAFGLAILTRGTFIYFLYALIAVTVATTFAAPPTWQQTAKRLLLAHLLALLFPLAFSFKNWLMFDFPFFATGSGNALYLGSHPLVNGYELPYYGLGYDVGAVTRGLHRLSIAGDEMLKGVALEILRDRPFTDLLFAYVQKTMAFIFVTKAVLPETIWNLRTVRIATLALSVIGLLAIRNKVMRWLLGSVLAYQVAVHIPILYTHRYSVGALDLWLTLLAALGMAALVARCRQEQSLHKAIGVLLVITVAVGVGEWHRRNSAPIMPNILAVPHERVWTWQPNAGNMLSGLGVSMMGPRHLQLTEPSGFVDIHISNKIKQLTNAENYVLSIVVSAAPTTPANTCSEARIHFRRITEAEFTRAPGVPLQIHPDGKSHTHHIGATLRLGLISGGDLRLVINCSPGTIIELAELYISKPRVAHTYRDAYLNRIAQQRNR